MWTAAYWFTGNKLLLDELDVTKRVRSEKVGQLFDSETNFKERLAWESLDMAGLLEIRLDLYQLVLFVKTRYLSKAIWSQEAKDHVIWSIPLEDVLLDRKELMDDLWKSQIASHNSDCRQK